MNTHVIKRDKPLILVVDDEAVSRIYIEQALINEGYKVITAENGLQAVESAKNHTLSMIVLDVMMPIMNGYEACAAIREQETQLNVPIIVLTALNDIESIEKSFDAGATDFVIKPVNLPIFKQRVRYGLKNHETDLELYHHHLRQSHAHKVARLGYWDWNIETGHLFWSDEVYNIFSLSPKECEINYDYFLSLVHPDDRKKVNYATYQSLNHGTSFSIEHRVVRADNQFQIVLQHAELITNQAGKVIRMQGIVQDITERHLDQEKIRHLAYFDSLTGLPNRILFHDRLTHALELAGRSENEVAVFIIDLDRFKNINDSLGHDMGDLFLQSVANNLKKVTRSTDTVARLGGDEFALIIEGINSKQGVFEVANKLLDIMSATHTIQDNELTSPGSIGIGISSPDNRDKEALIKQADLAMYKSKEAGGNQLSFYNEEMKSKAHQLLVIENQLRKAINNDELILFYQPKYCVKTNIIKGMEALVRWQHPTKGLVSPSDFIPVAEQTGLILPLGKWALEQACSQTREWHQQGFKDLIISVNISAKQFHHNDFADEVHGALKKAGISSQYLDLEITESCTVNDIETAINLLNIFRESGIHISLDDFGTGFSSLSYLNQLPLDTLKVDNSFIKDINEKGDNGELAKLIIDMAKSLQLRVVAEGIEAKYHLDFLKKNGCDEFQGFYASRPLPASQFEKLLISSKKQTSLLL